MALWKIYITEGPVAQWIERPPPKRQVGCSIQPRIIAQNASHFELGVC